MYAFIYVKEKNRILHYDVNQKASIFCFYIPKYTTIQQNIYNNIYQNLQILFLHLFIHSVIINSSTFKFEITWIYQVAYKFYNVKILAIKIKILELNKNISYYASVKLLNTLIMFSSSNGWRKNCKLSFSLGKKVKA